MSNEVIKENEVDFSKFSNLINPQIAGQLSKVDTMANELSEIKKLKLATMEAVAVASFKNQVKVMLEQNSELIMGLQNSPMGFKTDNKSGYDQNKVIECAVVALSYGCHLSGNHFNIIASNAYITKEGYFYKLSEMVKNSGLNYRIVHGIAEPTDKFETLWKIESEVFWSYGRNKEKGQKLSFVIKGAGLKKDWKTKEVMVDQYKQTTSLTTQDQIRGKADRKVMHWLWCTLTSSHIPDIPEDIDGDIIEGKVSKDSNVFEELEKEEKKVVSNNETKKEEKADKAQEEVIEQKQEESKVPTLKEEIASLETADHHVTWMLQRCSAVNVNPTEFKNYLVSNGDIKEGVVMNSLEIEKLADICTRADSIIDEIKKS